MLDYCLIAVVYIMNKVLPRPTNRKGQNDLNIFRPQYGSNKLYDENYHLLLIFATRQKSISYKNTLHTPTVRTKFLRCCAHLYAAINLCGCVCRRRNVDARCQTTKSTTTLIIDGQSSHALQPSMWSWLSLSSSLRCAVVDVFATLDWGHCGRPQATRRTQKVRHVMMRCREVDGCVEVAIKLCDGIHTNLTRINTCARLLTLPPQPVRYLALTHTHSLSLFLILTLTISCRLLLGSIHRFDSIASCTLTFTSNPPLPPNSNTRQWHGDCQMLWPNVSWGRDHYTNTNTHPKDKCSNIMCVRVGAAFVWVCAEGKCDGGHI